MLLLVGMSLFFSLQIWNIWTPNITNDDKITSKVNNVNKITYFRNMSKPGTKQKSDVFVDWQEVTTLSIEHTGQGRTSSTPVSLGRPSPVFTTSQSALHFLPSRAGWFALSTV